MKLSQLLSVLQDAEWSGTVDPDITAIEQDSRKVSPGALFLARLGGSSDGHQFIRNALAAGAAAVVGERPETEVGTLAVPYVQVVDCAAALPWLAAALYGFPARKLVMIGVTGTDGKTTTANLIHSILIAAGIRAGMISTINAVIGERILETGLHVTTPAAQDVQRSLVEMVQAGTTHCVLEATSHGLAQQRVDACDFDIAVATNITHEHLDFHGSLAAYSASKARLFESLSSAADKPSISKLAVLNRDDESYGFLTERNHAPFVTYGVHTEADLRAMDVELGEGGSTFTVVVDCERFPVMTPLVGAYNVSNCLAAVTVAIRGLGIDVESVQAGIAALQTLPGRMERIEMGQDFVAIVDFAHTPNAFKQALLAARELTSGSLIAVFGSAGLRDVAKRGLMGAVAGELADYTVITAEDPRTESLNAIMAACAAGCQSTGGVAGKTYWQIDDREDAIRFAVSLTGPGDLIMTCGKAHEQSMCFGETEYPWDERVALRAALAGRLGLSEPVVPKLPTAH